MKNLLTALFFGLIASNLQAQTNPPAQALPYTQDFGTSATGFSALPTGIAAWNGLNGGSVSTQALAEATVPTGNAGVTAKTASQTTGGTYGYSNSSNGRFYIQTSSNATNGVNQLATAINTGANTSVNIAYSIEVINLGSASTIGSVLQYRAGITGTWITVVGSAKVFTPSSTNIVGMPSSYNYTLCGLLASTDYQFRWAHWKSSGTSMGLGYDNISITGVASPTITASLATPTNICQGAAVILTPTIAGGTAPYKVNYSGSAIGAGATNVTYSSGTITTAATTGSGTANYQLTSVTDANGCTSSSVFTSVASTVSAPSVGGTVGSSTTLCSGASAILSLTGQTGNVTGWESSTDNFASSTPIVNTTTMNSVSALTTTTKYRATVVNGACPAAVSAAATLTIPALILTTTTIPSNTVSCDDNVSGYTYYGNGANYFFAINWEPGVLGGAGGVNAAVKASSTVGVTVAPAISQTPAGGASGTDVAYSMKRYWNVNTGGNTVVNPVRVRFYFSAAEKQAVIDAAGAGAVFSWFKTKLGVNYDPAVFVTASTTGNIADVEPITVISEGVESGVNYVEFETSHFSGGSGAASLSPAGPLPIELKSFTGSRMNEGNKLSWTTATEKNTNLFIVERSPNGKDDWKAIANINAAGNSNKDLTYSTIDANPVCLAYYRLKTIDIDKSISLSKVISIASPCGGFAVTDIYPNPANESVTIDYQNTIAGDINLLITDILGKVVLTQSAIATEGSNTIKIDISTLPRGAYFIGFSNQTDKVTRRIIKQ
jgi:hypothetical protein